MSERPDALTAAQVLDLPAMPKAREAFAALNVSPELGYELIKSDAFPLEVIRLGSAFRVRRSDLIAFLGIHEGENGAGAATPTPSVENAPVYQR